MELTPNQERLLASIHADLREFAGRHFSYGKCPEKTQTLAANDGLVRCDALRWLNLPVTPSNRVKANRELKKLAVAGLIELHASRGCRNTHCSLSKIGERVAKTLKEGVFK